MIKDCPHLDSRYFDCTDGVIRWECKTCGYIFEEYEDCKSGG